MLAAWLVLGPMLQATSQQLAPPSHPTGRKGLCQAVALGLMTTSWRHHGGERGPATVRREDTLHDQDTPCAGSWARRAGGRGHFDQAIALFHQFSTSAELADFLTVAGLRRHRGRRFRADPPSCEGRPARETWRCRASSTI